jgi:cation transport regulator ChaC
MINTTRGEMDEALLEKREGSIDNDNEVTTWVEYWLDGELVHRSVHVTLKKVPSFAGAELASIG